jgi:hypothetical protein
MQRTHERRPSERAWKHTVANTLTVYRSKRDFTKTPEPDSSAKATPSSERRYQESPSISIIVLVLLLGGGGWYGRRRWF